MKKVAIIISPNWHDYAEKYLSDCLASLARQTWAGESKIFLVDNETSDESYQYLVEVIKQVPDLPISTEIIRNRANDGFAKGNNEAMKLALAQGFNYLILFNMDTIIDEQAVVELLETAEAGKKIGAVQARLMLHPEQDKLNSLGNATHFLGFGYSLGNGDVYDEAAEVNDEIFYPSGAAVLFKAEVLNEVGLFDENLWMYAEDQDLGWRIRLAGYDCLLAEEAVVYHKYEFSRSMKRFYWMDRNRIIVMLKNYKLATLVLILPALILMELGLLFFAARGGWFKEKLKVYGYFFKLAHLKYIYQTRQNIQKSRKIKDRELIPLISSKITYQELETLPLKIANVIFGVYWSGVSKLIYW